MAERTQRSPISTKALNWDDLTKLPRGTQLIFFEREHHRRSKVALDGLQPDQRCVALTLVEGVVAGGSFATGFKQWFFAHDLGVDPWIDGRWNLGCALVLPEHADTLPRR